MPRHWSCEAIRRWCASSQKGFNGTIRPIFSGSSDEGRYRLLVEAVTDYAIYMLDPSGIVTTWESGAQRFKGYTADEIIGQHFSRFYTEEDQKAGLPRRALETAKREGKFEAEGWRSARTERAFGPTSLSIQSVGHPGTLSAMRRSPAT